MAIESVWCSVLQAKVTRVTDLEGAVIAMVCPEYDDVTSLCRVKAATSQDGPLGRLVEQASEGTVGSTDAHCELR